jgi:hypothetical protein
MVRPMFQVGMAYIFAGQSGTSRWPWTFLSGEVGVKRLRWKEGAA